jgi:nucleotide-binding universal stress UspA family protein
MSNVLSGVRPVIVVGYTPKDLGRAALLAAVEEGRRHAADLLVVNISRGDALVDTNLAEAESLRQVDELLDGAGLTYETRQVIGRGEPAEELVRAAQETGAILLVLGLRRRTPVGKLLLGSTAQFTLLNAPCPVLAVKGG